MSHQSQQSQLSKSRGRRMHPAKARKRAAKRGTTPQSRALPPFPDDTEQLAEIIWADEVMQLAEKKKRLGDMVFSYYWVDGEPYDVNSLGLAILQDKPYAVEHMIRNGFDPAKHREYVVIAALEGNMNILLSLLENGGSANINLRGHGKTLLQYLEEQDEARLRQVTDFLSDYIKLE